jgi:hypothetical protein
MDSKASQQREKISVVAHMNEKVDWRGTWVMTDIARCLVWLKLAFRCTSTTGEGELQDVQG